MFSWTTRSQRHLACSALDIRVSEEQQWDELELAEQGLSPHARRENATRRRIEFDDKCSDNRGVQLKVVTVRVEDCARIHAEASLELHGSSPGPDVIYLEGAEPRTPRRLRKRQETPEETPLQHEVEPEEQEEDETEDEVEGRIFEAPPVGSMIEVLFTDDVWYRARVEALLSNCECQVIYEETLENDSIDLSEDIARHCEVGEAESKPEEEEDEENYEGRVTEAPPVGSVVEILFGDDVWHRARVEVIFSECECQVIYEETMEYDSVDVSENIVRHCEAMGTVSGGSSRPEATDNEDEDASTATVNDDVTAAGEDNGEGVESADSTSDSSSEVDDDETDDEDENEYDVTGRLCDAPAVGTLVEVFFTDYTWYRATVLSSRDGVVFTVAFVEKPEGDVECENVEEIDPREDVVRVVPEDTMPEKQSSNDVCDKDSDGSTCDSPCRVASLADFDDSSGDELFYEHH